MGFVGYLRDRGSFCGCPRDSDEIHQCHMGLGNYDCACLRGTPSSPTAGACTSPSRPFSSHLDFLSCTHHVNRLVGLPNEVDTMISWKPWNTWRRPQELRSLAVLLSPSSRRKLRGRPRWSGPSGMISRSPLQATVDFSDMSSMDTVVCQKQPCWLPAATTRSASLVTMAYHALFVVRENDVLPR